MAAGETSYDNTTIDFVLFSEDSSTDIVATAEAFNMNESEICISSVCLPPASRDLSLWRISPCLWSTGNCYLKDHFIESVTENWRYF